MICLLARGLTECCMVASELDGRSGTLRIRTIYVYCVTTMAQLCSFSAEYIYQYHE